jgi:hypothetical protein
MTPQRELKAFTAAATDAIARMIAETKREAERNEEMRDLRFRTEQAERASEVADLRRRLERMESQLRQAGGETIEGRVRNIRPVA